MSSIFDNEVDSAESALSCFHDEQRFRIWKRFKPRNK